MQEQSTATDPEWDKIVAEAHYLERKKLGLLTPDEQRQEVRNQVLRWLRSVIGGIVGAVCGPFVFFGTAEVLESLFPGSTDFGYVWLMLFFLLSIQVGMWVGIKIADKVMRWAASKDQR